MLNMGIIGMGKMGSFHAEWISDSDMATDRRRLYLTMLGVCGNEEDLPLLEEMLRSTTKSSPGGRSAAKRPQACSSSSRNTI